VGAKFPAAAPYCATFTFADYAMDEYGVKVVYRTYSQDAEYAWLEQYARLQGKRRGLKMKAQFQGEIDQMKTELDDLVRSFKKGDYSDGLNGCSLK
jgi:Skp family chaperone for outer membrane proteins